MAKHKSKKEQNMDGETAIAFAANAFCELHPQETCPEWIGRCTAISYFWDELGNYRISFSVTPTATNNGIPYFSVLVNPNTAETTVLLDIDPNSFVGEELQGFLVSPRIQ